MVRIGYRTEQSHTERGMTLIELLVVVGIIGVLAAVAVFMFTRQATQARATEVNAVFAEIAQRQEQFLMENGVYQSTADDDSTLFPDWPNGPDDDAQALPALLGTWRALKVNFGKSRMYCGYVTVGGRGDDARDAAGTVYPLAGQAVDRFGFDTLPRAGNWFYMIAECDFDGDDTHSIYFSNSVEDGMWVENRGE